MGIIAVTSVGGAPGATTSALVWALAWQRDVLLAECSPAGGAVLPGFFRGALPEHLVGRGLWGVNLSAMEYGPEGAFELLWDHLVPLHEEAPRRMLLPGLADPFMGPQLAPSWPMLASLFRELRPDVLVDVGPLGPQAPFALLAAADLVVVVMRPTVRQTAAAVPRLENLRRALGGNDIALCLIGEARPKMRDDLHYSPDAVRRQLGEFALTLVLPHDPRSALRMSDGVKGPRNIEVAPLLREGRRTADMLRNHLDARQALLHRPGHHLRDDPRATLAAARTHEEVS